MNKILEHWESVAESYSKHYAKENMYDSSCPYPANYFRSQILLNSFVKKNVKRVIEIGVGTGKPLTELSKVGMEVYGFDISQNMIKEAKNTAEQNGIDQDRMFVADIQDPNSYLWAAKDGKFDGLIAMGVMPHIENDDMVLDNMSSLVCPGGSVFIEFRNSLFSLFTFNKNTVKFIVNDLICDVDNELREAVKKDLEGRLRIDQPAERDKLPNGGIGYDAILAKFHNPLTISELFMRHGFADIKLHWYHYHSAMPYMSNANPDLFRSESIKLEHEYSGWRGLFLCSAFVVEAVRK